MRDSENQSAIQAPACDGPLPVADRAARKVPYDEKEFFESFYRANLRGEPQEHMTIGSITELEARYHYNLVENAMIRAAVRRDPPPPGAMVEAWRMLQTRRDTRLLDIGSGTGHWIDFFRNVFLVSQAVGLEITDSMAGHLQQKYADCPQVAIHRMDIAEDGFDAESIGGPFDYITAVGVMFHLVDDQRWKTAVLNLGTALKPDGMLIVTDDLGWESRNVQFHNSDQFDSWRQFDRSQPVPGQVRVNKRVRSLADWHAAANSAGLTIVDLVRSERFPLITMPENDLLVMSGQ